jgi:hypothetical protein
MRLARLATLLVAVFASGAAVAPASARAETMMDAAIEAQRAPPGSIYVIVPPGGDLAEAFALGLGPQLRRHLSAFVLALQVPQPVLRLFESPAGHPPVPPARLVERLDALAVVTLRLETAPSRGRTTRSLWLAIDFAPYPGLAPRVEAAASTLQDGAAALADFERGLGPRWTRHAVLAMVAREFAQLGDAAEPPRLRALQQFLAQEARQAQAADPDAAALQTLRDAIDQAPRLRGRR